jgi:hypothetical protein
MKETFESYLKNIHFRDYPQLIDDNIPEHFDDWIGDQDVDTIMSYADDYAKQVHNNALKMAQNDLKGLFEDERPVDPLTGDPVETYGYEVTHNCALTIAINNIQKLKI